MNRDADAAKDFLEWLLHDPNSETCLEASGEDTSDRAGEYRSGVTDRDVKPVTQPIAETQNVMLTNLSQPNQPSSTHSDVEDVLSFEFGEMSAVQDRFNALLKRRLRDEIERNPPLFPWENEICDYEPETLDWESTQLVPVSVWLKQIQERLPVPMPDQLLASLFGRCQEVVHGSLQQGAKLVQAVETLFPGEEEMLNYLARLVLMPSFRDGSDKLQTDGFPAHYDVAAPVQQMALSLIAASQILESLTLRVSADCPCAERQWSTPSGDITVTVHHQTQPTSRLRIESHVPCSSHLSLQGAAGEASTHRDGEGCMSVELFDVSPNQTYRLTVQLADGAKAPLVFSIHVDA